MPGTKHFPQLVIWAKHQKVGTLIFNEPRVCSFTYDDEWQQNGFSISPCIPLSGTFDSISVINFIRNLFPEGGAFDVLLETENISKNNIYGILKTIGLDAVGAFSFAEKNYPEQKTNLRLIKEEELISRLDSGMPEQLLSWDGKYRLSVAGVQNKLNVFIDENHSIFLADGQFSSTHILKFASSQFPSVIINELYCMRLAKAVNIDVADVSHTKFGNHSVLVVKRFDRKIAQDSVEKRHMVDGCQALNLPPEFKYEQNFGSKPDVAHIREGASIPKLFQFNSACSIPVQARQKLIDWVLFNLIIGNSDAHGKNISYFVSKAGIEPAPFYDLVSVVYESKKVRMLETNLAMAIGDNFDSNGITAFDLLTLASESEIQFSLLKRRLDNLIAQCMKQLDLLDLSDQNLSDDQMDDINGLKQLIKSRCEYFSEQSEQFSHVIEDAF